MHKKLAVAIIGTLFCSCACNYASLESESLTDEGIKYYETKNLSKAMATFQTAVDRDLNNDRAHYQMALIDMDYRDYKAAVPRLNQAIGVRDMPLYWYTLGLAHKGDGDTLVANGNAEEALASYTSCVYAMQQAVKRDTYYAEALLVQGQCHIALGEYDDAIEALETSIRANPNLIMKDGTVSNYDELGRLYLKFGFFEEAVVVYAGASLNNPGEPYLEIGLAEVLLRLERNEEALTHFKLAYQQLEKKGDSKILELPAMLGAARSTEALAKEQADKKEFIKAREKYIDAKDWYQRFADSALIDSEKLRRAEALAHIKDIDEILRFELF